MGVALEFWTSVLQLPLFDIVHAEQHKQERRYTLTVMVQDRRGVCPQCHQVCEKVHQTRNREHIHDLPISGYAVELKVRVCQFWCEVCQQNFTPEIPFLADGAHATERFLERAAELIRSSGVANVAHFLGLPEQTLGRWYYDFVARRQQQMQPTLKPVRHIGIDELSLIKHRQFVAVIVDHDNHWVLEVLENLKKATVLAYLQQAKASGLLADVVEVTTDMWDAYVNAASEAFGPQVLVTTDRFHVIKNLQECMTAARRELQRTLSASEREELKGSRWLWQTNWANLNATQREQLTQLKLRFPTLGAFAEQREQFQALLEDRTLQTSAAGQSKLVAWLAQTQQLGLTALNRFAKTLGNWLSPISNYFVYHSTNGRTEGFNHGLRSILWRAYGMTNFQHFRLRVLHSFCLKPT